MWFPIGSVGGGSTDAFAVIKATYPAGATCVCTMGSTTIRAIDTSGLALLVVPEAGTWTVTATSGSTSASKEVVITEAGQVESVTLNFEVLLFNNGVIDGYPWDAKYVSESTYGAADVGTTIAMYAYTYDNGLVFKTVTAQRGLSIPIDLTPYKTVKAHIATVGDTAGTLHINAGSTSLAYNTAQFGTTSFSAGDTIELDVSAVTGEQYLSFEVISNSGSTNLIRLAFDKVWLSTGEDEGTAATVKVVGSATRPTDATPGTIWVKDEAYDGATVVATYALTMSGYTGTYPLCVIGPSALTSPWGRCPEVIKGLFLNVEQVQLYSSKTAFVTYKYAVIGTSYDVMDINGNWASGT